MRLIDADATVTVQSFDPMNEEYIHDEMTVERALDFATDEGCPPTIDAIPVGWIIDRANDPERAPLYRRYAQMLYEEWRKEQEAKI